uniref:Uncharacterized protein n=1 Tax=Arundo donax TaxID=35708 RepID=A0A0A8Y4H6_ARUDO
MEKGVIQQGGREGGV